MSKMRTVVVHCGGKDWAICQVEIPSDNRDERVSFGRMAMEDGLRYFNPVGHPPLESYRPADEPLPKAVQMLKTGQRIEVVAHAVAQAVKLADEDLEALSRDIVVHWWRHVGNAEVMRMEGAHKKWSETADVLHVMQFQKRRKFEFERVMFEIEHAIKMAQESHALMKVEPDGS